MNTRQKVAQTYNTIRHFTSRQWIFRIYYLTRNLNKSRKTHLKKSVINIHKLESFYAADLSENADIKAADDICNHIFDTISGITISFKGEIDWDLKKTSYRLVCFRLNSFRWLLSLSDAYRATNDIKYLETGFALIENWQKSNGKLIQGDKWNPYVIAERLMNWIGFVSCYAERLDRDIDKYARWIASHADELNRSVEFQLGANHLLSEGRSLMYAGNFLNNEKLYQRGKRILFKEFKIQFLNDGGHYERSVSYHVESLQQYFEAVWLMQHINDDSNIEMARNLYEPYCFLNAMIGPDGTIPLLNDAAYDYPFDAADFLYTAKILYGEAPKQAKQGVYSKRWLNMEPISNATNWKTKKRLFAETGLYVDRFNIEGQEQSIMFDIGNNGPDSNLGHAHADALSLLWTVGDKRILVDSGVFTYEPGEQRNLCRSTKAHNTVEIDDKSSAEIWSAFRVAKRGHTKLLTYKDVKEHVIISASHDGYCYCLADPVLHNRTIIRWKNREAFAVKDELLGSKEKHSGVLRYYFNPACSVIKEGDNSVVIDQKYLMQCSAPIRISNCKVAENFGILIDSVCVSAAFEIDGKTTVYTVFSYNLNADLNSIEDWFS